MTVNVQKLFLNSRLKRTFRFKPLIVVFPTVTHSQSGVIARDCNSFRCQPRVTLTPPKFIMTVMVILRVTNVLPRRFRRPSKVFVVL